MGALFNQLTEKQHIEIVTRGPGETQALGRRIGEMMQGGELVLMVGDLGAGKTCMTQGIAWGLGVVEYARSPTFVLVSEYEGRHTLYHADLYRIDDPLEIEDLGLDETYGNGGICVVEWAEKGDWLFPEDNLRVDITVIGAEERVVELRAGGPRHEELLRRLGEGTSDGKGN